MEKEWLQYVDPKRRRNFLMVFQELSKSQDKDNPDFVIIGAIPLLLKGYLPYVVQWDVDLLFRDSNRLREFVSKPKTTSLKVVNYDDDFMTSEDITSFHTAWSFDKGWVNVDYILRGHLFDFYASNVSELELHRDTIKLDNESFQISLFLAHPWDIFLEKATSPRTEKEIELKIDMSVDIRHIFLIYQKEKDRAEFWQRVVTKARRFNIEDQFKRNLLKIFQLKDELGYCDIDISPFSIGQIG